MPYSDCFLLQKGLVSEVLMASSPSLHAQNFILGK